MRNAGGVDPRTAMSQSVLDQANAYAMPNVAGEGGEKTTMSLGFAVLALLGVLVFNQMSEGRQSASIDEMMRETRAELTAAQSSAESARRDATTARAEAERTQRRIALNARQPQAAPQKPASLDMPAQANLRSPALVVDNSQQRAPVGEAGAASAGGLDAVVNGLTASDVFAQRVSAGGLEPVRATVINDQSRVAPQGTIIAGVLETAINSDFARLYARHCQRRYSRTG